jgi:hypothetical protein
MITFTSEQKKDLYKIIYQATLDANRDFWEQRDNELMLDYQNEVDAEMSKAEIRAMQERLQGIETVKTAEINPHTWQHILESGKVGQVAITVGE